MASRPSRNQTRNLQHAPSSSPSVQVSPRATARKSMPSRGATTRQNVLLSTPASLSSTSQATIQARTAQKNQGGPSKKRIIRVISSSSDDSSGVNTQGTTARPSQVRSSSDSEDGGRSTKKKQTQKTTQHDDSNSDGSGVDFANSGGSSAKSKRSTSAPSGSRPTTSTPSLNDSGRAKATKSNTSQAFSAGTPSPSPSVQVSPKTSARKSFPSRGAIAMQNVLVSTPASLPSTSQATMPAKTAQENRDRPSSKKRVRMVSSSSSDNASGANTQGTATLITSQGRSSDSEDFGSSTKKKQTQKRTQHDDSNSDGSGVDFVNSAGGSAKSKSSTSTPSGSRPTTSTPSLNDSGRAKATKLNTSQDFGAVTHSPSPSVEVSPRPTARKSMPSRGATTRQNLLVLIAASLPSTSQATMPARTAQKNGGRPSSKKRVRRVNSSSSDNASGTKTQGTTARPSQGRSSDSQDGGNSTKKKQTKKRTQHNDSNSDGSGVDFAPSARGSAKSKRSTSAPSGSRPTTSTPSLNDSGRAKATKSNKSQAFGAVTDSPSPSVEVSPRPTARKSMPSRGATTKQKLLLLTATSLPSTSQATMPTRTAQKNRGGPSSKKRVRRVNSSSSNDSSGANTQATTARPSQGQSSDSQDGGSSTKKKQTQKKTQHDDSNSDGSDVDFAPSAGGSAKRQRSTSAPSGSRPTTSTPSLNDSGRAKATKLNTSQAFAAKGSTQVGYLKNLINKCVFYILVADQKKHAIKKADIVKMVFEDQNSKQYYETVLVEANKILKKTFGMEILALEKQKNSYILVNILDPDHGTGEFAEYSEEELQKRGLILILLTIIFMNQNAMPEDQLWKALEPLGINPSSSIPHPVFGNIKKYITTELVKEMYLEYNRVNKDPVEYEFKWGERASQEVKKKDLLKFACTVMDDGTKPENWTLQFEDANS